MRLKQMTCLGCGRLVLLQPSGYCPPCYAVHQAAGRFRNKT